MNEEKNVRNARAEMEVAKQKTEKALSAEPKIPRRYKLYDRIKDKVSLRTIDTVIVITVVLIVIMLIFGIVSAKH